MANSDGEHGSLHKGTARLEHDEHGPLSERVICCWGHMPGSPATFTDRGSGFTMKEYVTGVAQHEG